MTNAKAMMAIAAARMTWTRVFACAGLGERFPVVSADALLAAAVICVWECIGYCLWNLPFFCRRCLIVFAIVGGPVSAGRIGPEPQAQGQYAGFS